LRTLGVTVFKYEPGIYSEDPAAPGIFSFAATADYCYGTDTCHGDVDKPSIAENLTMKTVDGKYVITKSTVGNATYVDSPAPWQDGKLEFITGKRVILAADPSESKLLPQVLPMAEEAAKIADRFAAMIGTTQLHYRIFLAGTKQWKSWYGGQNPDWTSASESLSQYGYDVLINVDQVVDEEDLQFALQRELGWDISLTGATAGGYSRTDDGWLSEGVSDYVGFFPQPASADWDLPDVRKAVKAHGLTAMNPKEPADSAPQATWNAFFGLSHLAVDCMAHQFGQQKTFTFVKQKLINSESNDQAAQDAFGQSFSAVNKTCVSWMKSQL
jgi:hypothetical protein